MTTPPDELHEYQTGELTVEWRPGRCKHAAECVRGLPAVFNTKRRPWIDVTAAETEAIIDTVHRCPSGALQVRRHDGATHEPQR